MKATHLRRDRAERGAVAVLVAIMIFVLAAIVALSVNAGHMVTVRAQLQNAADAGALAGARSLTGEEDGLLDARVEAEYYAEEHSSDNVQVSIGANAGNALNGDIVLGTWDFDVAKTNKDAAFTAATASTPSLEINAVLVRAGREAYRGSAVPVFMGGLFGQNEMDVGAHAVAVSGGPCEEGCAMPIVFAKCLVQPDSSQPVECGQRLVFTDATIDNIGFTNLDPGNGSVNTPTIIDILNGECSGVDVGDAIGVANGNNMTPQVIAALNDYIARNGNRVTAPIIDTGECGNPQFNQLQVVIGFASFTIIAVRGPPTQPQREIEIELDCEAGISESLGGCSYFGLEAEPRLVR